MQIVYVHSREREREREREKLCFSILPIRVNKGKEAFQNLTLKNKQTPLFLSNTVIFLFNLIQFFSPEKLWKRGKFSIKPSSPDGNNCYKFTGGACLKHANFTKCLDV